MKKTDFDNELKGGVTPILAEKIKAYSCHFYPFREDSFDLDNEDDRAFLQGYKYSTVYKSIRWFFETPEDLHRFCEMVES